MQAMQLRTDFNHGKSDLPIFELDAVEIEAVSGGATLTNITGYARSQYMDGGYYEIQRWTYSDGHVEYHTVFISVA